MDDIRRDAEAAGLVDVAIGIKHEYVAVMEDAGDSLYREILALLPSGHKLSDYIVSADISARSPGVRESDDPSCWYPDAGCCG